MTSTSLKLADGTEIRNLRNHEGRFFGVDSHTGRTVTYQKSEEGGCLLDSSGKVVRAITLQAGDHRETTDPSSGKPARRSSASVHRWATLNTFVDRVARYLDAHEQAVWLVLFRWTQNDTAEIRVADIASRIGRSNRTVQRALESLTAVGLIERLRRGTRQGGPSRYRLEPDPTIALAVLEGQQSQRDARVRLSVGAGSRRRTPQGTFTT